MLLAKTQFLSLEWVHLFGIPSWFVSYSLYLSVLYELEFTMAYSNQLFFLGIGNYVDSKN